MSGFDAKRERVWLHAFVLASCLVAILLTLPSKITINYASFGYLLGTCIFFYAVAILCQWRKIRFIGIVCELVGSGILLTAPVLVSTYLAFSLPMPLADPQLVKMDAALGFDWHGLITFVNSNYWAELFLGHAYSSFSFQLLAIPAILVALGHTRRAVAFVAGYGILCFISSFIAIWYPALGTYEVYGVSQADVPNIRAKFGFAFLDEFNALRGSETFVLDLNRAAGILTFPSVHAAVACFAIWAMWINVWTRYPFLVLNLGMSLSAVSHANHYLIDIIAGAGIAGITATLVSALLLGYRFEGFGSVFSVRRPAVGA